MKIIHIALLIAAVCILQAQIHAGPGCGSSCPYSSAHKKAAPSPSQSASAQGTMSGQWSSQEKDAILTLWPNGIFQLNHHGKSTRGHYLIEKDELVMKLPSVSEEGKWVLSRFQYTKKPGSLTLSVSSQDATHSIIKLAGVWSYQDEAPKQKG